MDREGDEVSYFVHLARQNAQAILADIIQQLPARNMAIPQRNMTMFGQIRAFRLAYEIGQKSQNLRFFGPGYIGMGPLLNRQN